MRFQQQHHEFIASQPGHQIGIPHLPMRALGHRLQQQVSMAWPWLSFTALKWFRSRNSNASRP
jgi:hypothetical protein